MKKFLATIAFIVGVGGLSASYFGTDAISQTTVHFGAMINVLQSLVLPVTSSDQVPVNRPGSGNDGFKVPATTWLQTANNLSDVANKPAGRFNLGFGTPFVTIVDYGGKNDGTDTAGVTTAAFNSCIASGWNCYLPTGTYQISCAAHTALLSNRFAPTTIFGDGYNQTYIRIAPSCAMPAGTGLINLANLRDLTIDTNGATAASFAYVVSNSTATQAVHAPDYQRVWMLNTGGSGANIAGFHIGSLSGQSVDSFLVKDIVYGTLSGTGSTTRNQCIYVEQAAGTVTTGKISGNQCLGSGINVSGTNLVIDGNYVQNWGYRAGIYTEQSANSKEYLINNNKFSNAIATVVSGQPPTDGIQNWGARSIISNNYCNTIGGACVANGGQNSTITANNAIGFGKRSDGFGGPAYYSNYFDATFNGNGSIWSGNYATDDGTPVPAAKFGFSDDILSANNSLMNNYFPVPATTGSTGPKPYALQD